MTIDIVQPESIDGFQQQLLLAGSVNKSITVVGSQSKSRVSNSAQQSVISTIGYSGVVDHQASDYTITVRTGTPVKQVIELLESVGQHLPFDPVFVDKGATVGGLIGAGLNGPCRLRFGGLRDFVIGCQFIDGRGRVIRAGGKVVKNAAGFDLPKFLIGSAGRFGLLLEVTFKVFPKPRFFQSVVFETVTTKTAVEMLQLLISSKMNFDGLEISENNQVIARWSAETEASLDDLQPGIMQQSDTSFHMLKGAPENRFWSDLANFDSADPSDVVIKVPIVPKKLLQFERCFLDLEIKRRFSAAGNLAILFLGSRQLIGKVSSLLSKLGLGGQVVVGASDQFLVGANPQMSFLRRVKSALDPENRFGPIENERLSEVAG